MVGSLTLCSESPDLQPPSRDQHLLPDSGGSPLQEALSGLPISLGREELPANPSAMIFFVFLSLPIGVCLFKGRFLFTAVIMIC